MQLITHKITGQINYLPNPEKDFNYIYFGKILD